MPVHNIDIADKLNQLADLLEIEGQNPFRVRAYQNAARVIADMPKDLSALIAEGSDLDDLPGIGPSIAQKVKELVDTGHLTALETMESKLPGHLADLLEVPNLGAKRVKHLHDVLGINNLQDLAGAVKAHQLQDLPGFGKKLARDLNRFTGAEKRLRLDVAEKVAEPLAHYLQNIQGVHDVVIAGSYRRRKETVGDLDILVTCQKDSPVMEHLITYDQVQQVQLQGPTRTTVILKNGMQVDVRVVPQESYGAALLYFTGSKPHNIDLRTTATREGYKINEYGVFRGKQQVAGKTEAEIYQLLGYSYIEPELRENRGELEAALTGNLPKLITVDQIKGDLHAHTIASDGHNTIEEMAEAAKAKGYEYLAITDHTQHTRVANGLDEKRYRKHLEEIERVNEQIKGITLLKSAEVDILQDGSLDLPNSILRNMDVVLCSIHYKFELPPDKQTERVLRAMDNPYMNIFCHPTGRLINKCPPYDINLERIMRAALDHGCYLELNSQPARLDLADHFCRLAKDIGLKLVISTDAHKVSDLNYIHFGISQARRGWLEAEDVINTKSLKEFRKRLKR